MIFIFFKGLHRGSQSKKWSYTEFNLCVAVNPEGFQNLRGLHRLILYASNIISESFSSFEPVFARSIIVYAVVICRFRSC